MRLSNCSFSTITNAAASSKIRAPLFLTAMSLLMQSSLLMPAAFADDVTVVGKDAGQAATASKQLAAIEIPAPATTNGAKAAVTPPATPATPTAPADPDAVPEKVLIKPGQPIQLQSSQEDLQPTDDVNLAREQKDKFADSPEAHFIYAVALTRTSRVEEALQEVRTARRLAMPKGGYTYFDKMIKDYEGVLADAPKDNRIRYGLAWAYYMKAYLLAQDSKKAQAVIDPAHANAPVTPIGTTAKGEKRQVDNNVAQNILQLLNPELGAKASAEPGKTPASSMPHVPSALEKAAPFAVPQIKQYYELAIKNLDEVIAQKPDDVWAAAYRWHLYAEYTGNVDESMHAWKGLLKQYPNNPALYLFYGEGWLKKGNLKECIVNVSHAIMLRGLGN